MKIVYEFWLHFLFRFFYQSNIKIKIDIFQASQRWKTIDVENGIRKHKLKHKMKENKQK